jgi:DNA-binding beta-propeller fold protein YncE
MMKMKRNVVVRAGACPVFVIAAAIVGAPSSQGQSGAPQYEVDLSWPKALPDRWVIGGLGGVCVDAQDHVLLLNRQDVLEGDLNAGHLAPRMIEIDPAGKVVNSWGDPKLLEDRQTGNILSTVGNGAGHFPGQFDQPHGIAVDSKGNIYVAENRGKRIQKFKVVSR